MSDYSCSLLSPEKAATLNPHLPVWFHPAYLNSIARLYSIEPVVLICYKKQNPVAYLPFFEKNRFGWKKAYSPVLFYYNPLIYDLPDRKFVNRTMLLQYEVNYAIGCFLKSTYRQVMLNLHPGVTDMRGFKDAGLVPLPLYTFVKDLHQPIEFFSDEMTTLRRALKADYLFDSTYRPQDFLHLVDEMVTRKQMRFRLPQERHLELLNSLHDAGILEQYNILHDGEVVSSDMIIKSNDGSAYGMLMATRAEDMKNGASLLLYWNLFTHLGEKYECFDLCGANIKGPSRVKAAIGAELRLFFRLTK